VRGIILRGLANHDTGQQTGNHREGQAQPVFKAQGIQNDKRSNGDQGRTHVYPSPKSAQQFLHLGAFFSFHQKDTQNREHNTHSCNQHRSKHCLLLHFSVRKEGRGTQSCRSKDGTAIRFIKVSAHTGHIPHIVTHIVGNGGRVPGIILRNTGFYLTHQVGADIGSLGVDTASHAGKQGLSRSPHPEGQHGGSDHDEFVGGIGLIHKGGQNKIPQ